MNEETIFDLRLWFKSLFKTSNCIKLYLLNFLRFTSTFMVLFALCHNVCYCLLNETRTFYEPVFVLANVKYAFFIHLYFKLLPYILVSTFFCQYSENYSVVIINLSCFLCVYKIMSHFPIFITGASVSVPSSRTHYTTGNRNGNIF